MSNLKEHYNKKETNMSTVLFRADSSSTIGTGHIMRDLVLAEQYSNAKIIFVTQELTGNINHKIKEAGYKVELLHSNDVKEFITVVEKYKAELVVIDNYEIDYKYEQILKENTGVKILAFDDTYEKHYCDILLNHNLSANEARYKGLVPDNCELRCGSKYTLLRSEFHQKFPKRLETKEKNILVAMGGVDSRELNIKILKILCSFDNVKINVITTTANKNLNVLQEYAANLENVTLHINTNEVAKLMHESDFSIVTPSVSVNEAYFMKLPFIAIKTEDNQIDIYEYLQKNGFSTLEKFDTKLLKNIIKIEMEK